MEIWNGLALIWKPLAFAAILIGAVVGIGCLIWRLAWPESWYLKDVASLDGKEAVAKLFAKYGQEKATNLIVARTECFLRDLDVSRRGGVDASAAALQSEVERFQLFADNVIRATEQLGNGQQVLPPLRQLVSDFCQRQPERLIERTVVLAAGTREEFKRDIGNPVLNRVAAVEARLRRYCERENR